MKFLSNEIPVSPILWESNIPIRRLIIIDQEWVTIDPIVFCIYNSCIYFSWTFTSTKIGLFIRWISTIDCIMILSPWIYKSMHFQRLIIVSIGISIVWTRRTPPFCPVVVLRRAFCCRYIPVWPYLVHFGPIWCWEMFIDEFWIGFNKDTFNTFRSIIFSNLG